ncbi:MAG: oxygen-independent coproporphyrinogen III oxidase [Phenylobacterium sp.]
MTHALAAAGPLTQTQLIAKYDGRAPRYTSYPTAVQFTPQVTSETYRDWLKDLPADDPVSLYLHIPFCARLCWYCGCNTRAVNTHQPIGDYVALMLDELAMLESALPGRLRADAVHLGGGTPNMLTPQELVAVFGRLREVFDLSPAAEIAAELDPAVLTREWVRGAALVGLNRASLGVQNLDRRVQEAVNRKETFDEIAACVGWLREAGVRSINLDLMYGLPHQTVENTLSTLEAVLRLRPERLALFGYAHVPWMKAHQQLIHEASLPGPAERLDQSEAAADRLISEGYVQIGLDHFALPQDELAIAAQEGRLHRNFQGYTADAAPTLLGLGASAIGALPQGYVQNISQELGWRAAVSAGDLPIARGVAITSEDRFRGEIIERLMCDLEVDLAAVCVRHGRSVTELANELARLEGFERDGLVRRDGASLAVTELGRVLVRSVCTVFDTHLAPEAQRHSKAL